MIYILEGGIGSGKTTVLNYLRKEAEKRGEKVSQGVDLDRFGRGEYTGESVFLDEEYHWYDCRTSQSKGNKIFSYLASGHRHYDISIHLSAIQVSMVDKRIRRLCGKLGRCFLGRNTNKVYVHWFERSPDPEDFEEWIDMKETLEIPLSE